MKKERQTERRRFLKRAVYHAPVLYMLGTLSTSLHADFSGGPVGPPGGLFSTRSSKKRPTKRKTLRF